MDFNEYQEFATTTWKPTDWAGDQADNASLAICGLGISGEAGEVADAIKKLLHYFQGAITADDQLNLMKEMGDVLWYMANLCTLLGVEFADVAAMNKVKLTARQKAGTIVGKGDNR